MTTTNRDKIIVGALHCLPPGVAQIIVEYSRTDPKFALVLIEIRDLGSYIGAEGLFWAGGLSRCDYSRTVLCREFAKKTQHGLCNKHWREWLDRLRHCCPIRHHGCSCHAPFECRRLEQFCIIS